LHINEEDIAVKTKLVGLVLILCMVFSMAHATAETASVEAQLADIVKSALDSKEIRYEYDAENNRFSLEFALDSALGSAVVTIFLYDDMVSVVVDSPIKVKQERFENAAVFTTLANCELYYAQFRIDYESGWLSCRSCNVIETVLPAEEEIITLLYMPIGSMDDYGDGIAAVCTTDADPYEAFEACKAAKDAA
jgi:hypothetical protein